MINLITATQSSCGWNGGIGGISPKEIGKPGNIILFKIVPKKIPSANPAPIKTNCSRIKEAYTCLVESPSDRKIP